MKILILGAGGVGGYYGARLQEAGADVTWLVRPARLQNLREHGLRIESPHGNLNLQVKAVTADMVQPEYDLIMLAPKAYDLDSSLDALAKATSLPCTSASGSTILLPFLNGMAHLEELDRRFGRQRVAAGVVQIAATLEDGIVKQLTDMHLLTAGPRDPSQAALLKAFIDLCGKTSFTASYADNIEQPLWTKWTFLATLAGGTTLFRGPIGKIVATSEGENLMREMYAECTAVAAANGCPVPEKAQQGALARLLEKGSGFTASMYRDLTSGQQTEHHHILGEMCRKAAASQLPAPLMRAAWCHMQVETGR